MKDLARGRKCDPAGRPLEKRVTKLAFQVPDAAAQSRLSDAEPLGRLTEVQRFANSKEIRDPSVHGRLKQQRGFGHSYSLGINRGDIGIGRA
jgi:hypothetical protein